jgi:hypothetical protein
VFLAFGARQTVKQESREKVSIGFNGTRQEQSPHLNPQARPQGLIGTVFQGFRASTLRFKR